MGAGTDKHLEMVPYLISVKFGGCFCLTEISQVSLLECLRANYTLYIHEKCIKNHLLIKLASMTQLLLHTFAHLTEPSFRVKAKLLPNKFFLGLL